MARKPVVKKEVAVEAAPAETKQSASVSVKNVTKTWFRQPSSNTRIDSNETKPMNNDGWLQSQIEAGFMVIQ